MPMPGTYAQLLLHIVTSTKGRTPWISTAVAARLYPDIGGIVRAEKGGLYEIGGVEDHVHMYLRWRPDGPVSNLMRTDFPTGSATLHPRLQSPAPPGPKCPPLAHLDSPAAGERRRTGFETGW